jgi:rsbT antagonist protein RsbS
MEVETILSRIGIYQTRGCLVVPVQVELSDDLALQLQTDILKKIKETNAEGLVIDLSGVTIVDVGLGQVIVNTARMASLFGTRTVITGLSAGVVASLVDLDFDPGDTLFATSLDAGFSMVEPGDPAGPEPEETEAGTDEDETPDEMEMGG